MAVVSMKQFLEAGVHFGHQTKRWNPKMRPYVFGSRNGIHIIDLQKTLRMLKEAYEYVRDLSARGETILFVGTKQQARDIVKEEALRSSSHFINERWLGGLLTNFNTIKASIAKMRRLEEQRGEDGLYEGMIKKEALQVEKQRIKLEKALGGIRDMRRMPGAIFVIDCKKEKIALSEAQKLGIPIVAVVDTNCNPDLIDYVIPGNDDAIRAIRLFAMTIASAVMEGRAMYDARMRSEAAEEKPARKAPEPKAEAAPAPDAERPAKPEVTIVGEPPAPPTEPAAEAAPTETAAADTPPAETAPAEAAAAPPEEAPAPEAQAEPAPAPKPAPETGTEPAAQPEPPPEPAAKAEPAPEPAPETPEKGAEAAAAESPESAPGDAAPEADKDGTPAPE